MPEESEDRRVPQPQDDRRLRDEVDDNFAPSLLPEVVITPQRTPQRTPPRVVQPVPNAPIGGRIIAAVGRSLNPLLMLFMPGNMGPEGTGNLVEGQPQWRPPGEVTEPPPMEPELQELPEVIITPTRPPRPPGGARVGEDPIMPPNWNDLADPTGVNFGRPGPGIPLIPYPVRDSPRGPATGNPGTTGDPVADPVAPSLEPEPLPTGPSTFPSDQPAPDILTTPWPSPGPGPFGDPVAVPLPQPGAWPSPGPTTGPAPGTTPLPGDDLVPLPFMPGIPDVFTPPGTRPQPIFTPPTPPLDYRPPAPDTLRPPEAEPFEPYQSPPQTPKPDSDACSCEKPPKKKKPKKQREVCYRGTYRQLKKSIVYKPREQVPCTGPAESKSKKPARPRAGALSITTLGV